MKQPIKIVIVDDDADYLFTMSTFLERNGYEVSTAGDGKDGLELIRKTNPDLILLDVMMETLFSGFELCKAIRRDPTLRETPILGISGIAEELGVGVNKFPDYEYFSPDQFLEKPVDKDRLLNVIKQAMETAEKRKNRPQWKKDLEESQIKKFLNR